MRARILESVGGGAWTRILEGCVWRTCRALTAAVRHPFTILSVKGGRAIHAFMKINRHICRLRPNFNHKTVGHIGSAHPSARAMARTTQAQSAVPAQRHLAPIHFKWALRAEGQAATRGATNTGEN